MQLSRGQQFAPLVVSDLTYQYRDRHRKVFVLMESTLKQELRDAMHVLQVLHAAVDKRIYAVLDSMHQVASQLVVVVMPVPFHHRMDQPLVLCVKVESIRISRRLLA